MKFPKYIALATSGGSGFTEMRHTGKGEYYRDAGCWGMCFVFSDKKLIADVKKAPTKNLETAVGIEITEEAWYLANSGYLPGAEGYKENLGSKGWYVPSYLNKTKLTAWEKKCHRLKKKYGDSK